MNFFPGTRRSCVATRDFLNQDRERGTWLYGLGKKSLGWAGYVNGSTGASTTAFRGNFGLWPGFHSHHVIGSAQYPFKLLGTAFRADQLPLITAGFEQNFKDITTFKAAEFIYRHLLNLLLVSDCCRLFVYHEIRVMSLINGKDDGQSCTDTRICFPQVCCLPA